MALKFGFPFVYFVTRSLNILLNKSKLEPVTTIFVAKLKNCSIELYKELTSDLLLS